MLNTVGFTKMIAKAYREHNAPTPGGAAKQCAHDEEGDDARQAPRRITDH